MGNLIPRNVLFGNPDRANVNLSTNGKYVSYLSNKDGVLNIFVADIENLAGAKPVTNDTGRGIHTHTWCHDNKHILYLQDSDGDENFKIYIVNVETLDTRLLTPKSGVRAIIFKASHKYPDEIIVGLNERRGEYFDLYKLNINTGELSLIYQNDKYSDLVIDHNHNLRFASLMNPNGALQIYEFKNDQESLFITVPYEDFKTFQILGFNEQCDKIYLANSIGRNTSALYTMDLNTHEQELIYSNSKVDIESVHLHPITKHIQIVSYDYDKSRYEVIDQEFGKHLRFLESLHEDANLFIRSTTLEQDKMLVTFEFDNGPARYYLYDKHSGVASYLFNNRVELENYKLSHMHPVVIKSRDGMDLMSYISVPLESAISQDSYETKEPIPMVLYVHGGPNARDSWGFHSVHQWLTNRGYAVLSVNYRGSVGFGKEFIVAGDGQWAEKMHDDLIDTVNWAIDKGIADKDKIAIMGGSYGGYAALVGLTFTPDVFACGINIVGPSNLMTLLKSIPPYWTPMVESLKKMLGGDADSPEGVKVLESKSPLHLAHKIQKPLLIGHGANDPRVKRAESDQIVNKLNELGIPVIYALFPDEGHGFAKPENKIAFFAITELFLAKYLDGKSESVSDEDLGSSSMCLESGSEYVLNGLTHEISE